MVGGLTRMPPALPTLLIRWQLSGYICRWMVGERDGRRRDWPSPSVFHCPEHFRLWVYRVAVYESPSYTSLRTAFGHFEPLLGHRPRQRRQIHTN